MYFSPCVLFTVCLPYWDVSSARAEILVSLVLKYTSSAKNSGWHILSTQ